MAYSDVVINDGPIGYWRLDDTGSLAMDSSGNGHTGTLAGTITKSVAGALAGDADTAMTFDGSTAKIPTTGGIGLGTNYTIEAWIKSSSAAQQAAVSNRTGGDGVYFGIASGKAFAYLQWGAPGAMNGVKVINDSNWHYLAWTGNGTTSILYVDGVSDFSVSQTIAASPAQVVNIGWDSVQPVFWSGSLDEVAIYNKVLTPTQVTAHYTAGITTPPVAVLPSVTYAY